MIFSGVQKTALSLLFWAIYPKKIVELVRDDCVVCPYHGVVYIMTLRKYAKHAMLWSISGFILFNSLLIWIDVITIEITPVAEIELSEKVTA